jgi:hypothetical protein
MIGRLQSLETQQGPRAQNDDKVRPAPTRRSDESFATVSGFLLRDRLLFRLPSLLARGIQGSPLVSRRPVSSVVRRSDRQRYDAAMTLDGGAHIGPRQQRSPAFRHAPLKSRLMARLDIGLRLEKRLLAFLRIVQILDEELRRFFEMIEAEFRPSQNLSGIVASRAHRGEHCVGFGL